MNEFLRELQDENMTAEPLDWGEDAATFGDRLARAREQAGMDQSQLARRIGVRVSTIRNWETDRSEPRANRLQILSGLLNVSIVWLMTGIGDGPRGETEAELSTDMKALLTELRELRLEQTRLAERTGRIEKKLRALALAG